MVTQNNNLNGNGDNGSYKDMSPAFDFMSESLFRIIWRSRWLVLLSIVGALLLGFAYVFKATPIYTSTSSIYVEQGGPKIMAEMDGGVMTQSKNYLYNQAVLLKSTPIISAALDYPEISRAQTFTDIDNPIAYLKKKLDVSVGKKDDIVNISFNSPYPAEAAQVVNKIVESYINYHTKTKKSTASEVLRILRAEKEKSSKEYMEKLNAIAKFKEENEALALDTSRGNMVIERLDRLSSVLTEAQLDTIEKQSAYESTKDMVDDPSKLRKYIEAQKTSGLYISTNRQEDVIKQNIDQLEFELENLLRQVKESHPLVVEKQSQIAHSKKQLAELENQFIQAQLAVAEQEYIDAKEKEDQIAEYYEQQRQEVIKLNQQFTQFAIIQSECDMAKNQCDLLDERIKQLNVTEDVGVLNISIVEVAEAAEDPSEPQKARIMAIALMLGLMLGTGLALLRGWMDQKMHSAEEISTILDLPVLGIIPSMSKRQSISERGQKVHKDSRSPIAEAYRTIRTSVFFGAPKGKAKTIVITSPAPGDGKTTMSSNLAIAMAQSGQKTLLIDADFRKPMQHNIFQINHEDIGLSSLIAGMVSSKDATKQVSIPNLELLTCGPSVPNPSELLNSESFLEQLRYFSEIYDRIVIDSPPVMPVTDSQILAATCDITLLVLRAEKSTRKTSQQAKDGLISVGAHLLGVVVNDVKKSGSYGYYSHYGYYGKGKNGNNNINSDKDFVNINDRIKSIGS